MYSVQRIGKPHEHVNLKRADEKGGEVVKPSVNHEERCRIGNVYRRWNGTKK